MKFSNLPSGISEAIANKIVQVINVYESGSKEGKYDALVVYKDFSYKGNSYRQVTFGKSQTTEFGNLKNLLQSYIEANGTYANQLKPYITKIGKITNGIPQSLCDNSEFKSLLKIAGKEDLIMQTAQDAFFDRYYFQPAVAFFNYHKFAQALSLLVIYDSFIHSGGILSFLRQRFSEMPPLQGGDEKKWIKQYTDVRHHWLSNHNNAIVRASNYRTTTYRGLIAANNWDLSKPFKTQSVQF